MQVHGDRTAVIDADRQLTYRELGARVSRLGGALDRLGLPPGAFVGTLAGNTAAHLECWLAVPAHGRVINSLNHRLAPDELAFMIDDSGTRVLVADDARLDAARDLRERCEALEHVVHAGDAPTPGDCIAYEALLDDSEPARAPDPPPDTLAAISYTGGTTGLPKGVMLSHGNLVANAKHFLFQDALTPEDRYVHAGPMFHVADSTMVFCVTWAGGAHILLDRFDLPRLVHAIEAHGATVLVLVPTMIQMLLEHLEQHPADLGGLRLLHYAAAPMSESLLERAMRTLSCDFLHGYGMTEAAPGVTYLSPADHRAGRHLRSVGHAIPGVQVEIRDPFDRPLPDGEVGEVCVRGPNVMLGLLEPRRGDARGAERRRLVPNRRRRAPRRRLPVPRRPPQGHDRQRRRERVLDRGRERDRLAPRRARGRGRRASGRALGRARPRDRRPRAGRGAATGTTIVEHCRPHIAGFKLPRSFEFRDEPLPKTGAGKVLKAKLRAPAAEPRSP